MVLKTAENTVPEILLKKRKHLERAKAQRLATQLLRKNKNKKDNKVNFKRAEYFVKEYRTLEREGKRMNREVKSKKKINISEEPTLLFVLRIKNNQGVPPKARKILHILRLNQFCSGTFVKLNRATITMLKMIEPYIVYGEPSLKSVRELIYKRGYAKIEKKKVPLTDNTIIENALGQYNIICMEDLVHEIITLGDNFKFVNNFIWPFKLSIPNDTLIEKKTKEFIKNIQCGDCKDYINEIISKMN